MGGAAGKMISPQSISIATATVGIENRQNEIMRRSLVYCICYVFVMGLIGYGVAVFLRGARGV
jgi:lactate permease